MRRPSLLPVLIIACALCAACDGGVISREHVGYPIEMPDYQPPEVKQADADTAAVRVPPVQPPAVTPAGLNNLRQIDEFIQSAGSVDILWVIDTSGSMANERERLVAAFDRFLGSLYDSRIDFHLGVISTANSGARGGRLMGTPPFLTAQSSDPAKSFRESLRLANTAVVQEEGLASLLLALTPPRTDNENKGFLRPEADLFVIIISDEDDQSRGKTGYYIRQFKLLMGAGNENRISINVIAGLPPEGCTPPGDEGLYGAEAEPGLRYIEAAESTGGLVESICNPDYNGLLTRLASRVRPPRRVFPLRAPPIPNTLAVTVDGVNISLDPLKGYAFDAVNRLIRFDGDYTPPVKSRIRISYEVQR
ncbi:MAG: hypothetical protein GMKNLPBB_01254 [Myxococcota bacterium]|nr:hypothetical protein [Myxococcota bacterium]